MSFKSFLGRTLAFFGLAFAFEAFCHGPYADTEEGVRNRKSPSVSYQSLTTMVESEPVTQVAVSQSSISFLGTALGYIFPTKPVEERVLALFIANGKNLNFATLAVRYGRCAHNDDQLDFNGEFRNSGYAFVCHTDELCYIKEKIREVYKELTIQGYKLSGKDIH